MKSCPQQNMGKNDSAAVKVKPLTWDSCFFGCNIARADIVAESCSTEELKAALSEQAFFDVCYIFVNGKSEKINNCLHSLNAVMYCRKVTFCKEIPDLHDMTSYPDVIELKDLSKEAIQLAVASGVYSRFYLDQGLRSKQPVLYERWIKNCLEHPGGKVFAICQSGTPVAIAGVQIADRTGHLELISVHPDFRRRGYAKKVIAAAEKYYLENNVSHAEIITQKKNTAAIATYASCGYLIKEEVDVWHLWRKTEVSSKGFLNLPLQTEDIA